MEHIERSVSTFDNNFLQELPLKEPPCKASRSTKHDRAQFIASGHTFPSSWNILLKGPIKRCNSGGGRRSTTRSDGSPFNIGQCITLPKCFAFALSWSVLSNQDQKASFRLPRVRSLPLNLREDLLESHQVHGVRTHETLSQAKDLLISNQQWWLLKAMRKQDSVQSRESDARSSGGSNSSLVYSESYQW